MASHEGSTTSPGATRAKEPRWVVELLESDEKFKADETKDVRSVTRMLYRDNDQVKEQIAKHAATTWLATSSSASTVSR